MKTKVRRVGTSLGVLLPGDLCRRLELQEGDVLFAGAREGDVLLSRAPREPELEEFMRLIRPMLGRDILKVYLFGSYVTGRFRPGKSDLDLYILAKRGRAPRVQERVLKAVFQITLAGGRVPLGPVVVDASEFDEGWFDYEVKPGYCLYDAALPHPPR
ncbi:MAG: nucleotidyltransferase domain-containing protein [Euryarchaeota archaeon]|nr:nucleotidyltransferase domain-containing protein [Euryarchaeota archaeon]